MTRDPSQLANQTFDLLVIGGGIIGAGIIWDASLRGLSCALVEQGDFASGTSSKTTKLIHGGIRYLESFDFKLVRQAIRERQILLKLAPGLVKPLPFLIPVIGNSPRPWPLVKLGVTLYDWMAGRSLRHGSGQASIQPHRFLNRQQVAQMEPLLSQLPLERGALYHDAQMEDARLVLEVLKIAHEHGAKITNHCSVVRFLSEKGHLSGALVEDRLDNKRYEARAKLLINATGPWVDRLRQMASPGIQPIVRPSKGIHLVYPDLGLKHALLLSSARDQRIFFLIPWKGLTLIGTTDTDYQADPGQVTPNSEEVNYLIEETNRALPQLKLQKEKVISTFAGVRPLVLKEKKDPWAVSRMHLIHEDPHGLVSIVGGKFTTFRQIAQEVVDRVSRRFPEKRLSPCKTAQTPLGPLASNWRTQEIPSLLKDLIQQGSIYPPGVSHLIQHYGVRAKPILEWIQADRRLADPLCPHHPFIKAEVRYAAQKEMALSLSDLFWRRLGIGWSACQGLDALESAAQVMAENLGWSTAELERQKGRYQEEVAASRQALS